MTETEKKLIELSANKFSKPIENLSPEKDFFETLGINSLQALSLLSELEIAFNVEIPDYELQDVKTFAELSKVIDRRRG